MPWWPDFTKLLGGFRPHELTLLCAPTGAGKSSLLASISAQLCLNRVPHFAAPVETGDTDFVVRVASALSGRDWNTGEAFRSEQYHEETRAARGVLAQSPLYIATHDNRVAVETMLDELKYMAARYGVRIALLDNLNFFLDVVSSAHEKAEMDSAIHEFVMLAKKLPMHIVLVVHPRKTEGGRVESEFDIKGSSTAVQECSNVLLFNRARIQDLENGSRRPYERELVFRKIRKRGHNVGKPIWFSYANGRYQEQV